MNADLKVCTTRFVVQAMQSVIVQAFRPAVVI